MKVGIFVTNQNPLGTDMVSALDEQFAMTRLARDRGWNAVGTGQHYLSEGMSQLQLIPFLARLAAEAGEMTGVAGVLLINLHNPVEVAECIASLDVIWRGNFVFGVGLGYREVEFDAFKVPKGQRLRRFEECLEIVKRLWTEDKVSVETDVCTLANVTLTCRPVQKPHPPIWFAANNDAAVRRAARLGDAWFVNPARDHGQHHAPDGPIPRRARAPGKAATARAGRSSRRSTARRTGRRPWSWPGHISVRKYRAYASWGQDAVLPDGDTFRQPFEALLRDRFVLGSPEDCYEQLRPCWEAVGANFLFFRTHWLGMPLAHALASMRLMSDELLPALRQVKG